MNTFFFLLAGGYGKRTEPLSFYKPKPAFPLDGTPLLQIMLNQLACLGLHQGFINLHHLPDIIRHIADSHETNGPKEIVYLQEEILSGSGILQSAYNRMAADDLLLVINGDIFLELPFQNMRDKLLQDKADGLLLVRPFPTGNSSYRPLQLDKDRFLTRTDKGDFMYTGTALFTKKVILQINQINFFDTLEASSFNIKVLPYTGIWLDIGDISSYQAANFAYQHYRQQTNPVTTSLTNSLSLGVTISADSHVTHSIIWENTIIQNHSHLHNCIVTNNLNLDATDGVNEIITENRYI